MTNDPLFEQLREISWRRKLSSAEEERLAEWLAAHPQAQEGWDSESSLNQALDALSDVPVASNFTSRVVAEAKRQADAERRMEERPRSSSWWIRWLPRTALAGIVLAAGLISYEHIRAARRAEWAESLATVSQLPSLPSPEVLRDFDAIAALGSTPPADEELLRLMQ